MICAANPFIRLICLALTVYWIILLARVIVSWIELAGWRPPTDRTAPHDLRAVVRCDGAGAEAAPADRAAGRSARSSVIVAFVIIFVLQKRDLPMTQAREDR